MLFAKALKSANVDDLLTNIAAAAPAGGAAGAGPAADQPAHHPSPPGKYQLSTQLSQTFYFAWSEMAWNEFFLSFLIF